MAVWDKELIRRGVVVRDNCLWSATALLSHPEVVRQVHTDYINAGAEVIITNTYTTLKSRLASEGLGDRFAEMNVIAGQLAQQAQQQAQRDVWVAGCLPPIWRSYRPDLVGSAEQAEQIYSEFAAHIDPYVDFYIAETASTAAEAIGAARAIARLDKPLWVSWTLLDDGSPIVRNGQDIADVVAAVVDLPIDALLLNCSAPESIGAGIARLVSWLDSQSIARPVGGYGNGFTPIPEKWQYTHTDSLPTQSFGYQPCNLS